MRQQDRRAVLPVRYELAPGVKLRHPEPVREAGGEGKGLLATLRRVMFGAKKES